MRALDLAAIIILALMSLAVVYLWLIGLAGLLGKKRRRPLSRSYDFLILVPAHNESAGIAAVLDSLRKLQTCGRVEIAVVADNCTDDTATIARESGVAVYERHDDQHRGKGHALRWGMAQYDLTSFHAVVIVDADTLVKPDLLYVVAQTLETGAGAVQVSDEFYIAQPSPLAYLQQVGNMAENVLFYRGRAILGLPVLLRGTGMAIRTEVLQEFPWRSFSVTEDVDYGTELILNGVKVVFAAESAVLSPATSTYRQSAAQKERWASGTFSLVFDRIPSLIRGGLKRRRLDLIELAFSLFLLSRPLMMFLLVIPFLISLLGSSGMRSMLWVWTGILAVLLVLYLVGGVFFVPDRKKAALSLLHIPLFGVWLFVVQIKAFVRRGRKGWVRTERLP